MGVQASMPRLTPSRAALALACLSWGACAPGCKSRPLELEVPSSCQTPEVPACLQKYSAEELDEAALRRLQQGLRECFARDPERLAAQASCLPLELGKDAASGRAVVAHYFCSDLCPAYGGVLLKLGGGINQEACCKLGGAPFIDAAWGGYRSCMPAPGNEAVRERVCRKP